MAAFAYELRASETNGEPIHRVCALCYKKGEISILQFSHKSEGQDWYDCHSCKNNQHFGAYVRSENYDSAYSNF